MSERASIYEEVQIGPETVPGTEVNATTRLSSMGISIRPAVTTRRFRPMGRKLDTLLIPGRKSSEGDVEGVGSFVDPIYPLCSLFGATTPTGTTSYEWLFELESSAPELPKTYTIESGSAVRAALVTHGVFTEFSMEFSTEEVNIGGALIGQRYQDGITRTPGPLPQTAQEPIIPDDTDVFIDPTFGAMGTTKMTRALSAEFQVGNRYSPLWVMNSSNESWVAVVETPPDVTMGITVEADAAGMGLLTSLENGSLQYFRLQNVGGVITGSDNYELNIDLAGRVEGLESLGDEDGVYAASWTIRAMDTDDLVGASVLLRNDKAAL